MKKFLSYLVLFVAVYFVAILMSNKYIHISLMNASYIEEIEISYQIDNYPEKIATVKSSPTSLFFDMNKTSLGKHSIRIACDTLNLERTIEVFTIKNNYLDFEFQSQSEEGNTIITRYSWYSLVYM